MQNLRRKIQIGPRLPVWRMRLLFGAVMLTFSEIVVWQNPPARQWYEWPVLYVLYVAAGAILLDLLVRYQAHTPAAVGLACGVYGLISSSVINHSAFYQIPFGLLVRGLGLQVGAGFLGLMLFVMVMRGRAPDLLTVGGAALAGVAWGIWLHWYPIQATVAWGPVTIENAQIYLMAGLAVVGFMFYFVPPRFGTVRETSFGLLWWEIIAVAVPLFIALLIGMLQNNIPFLPLFIPIAIGMFCIWALRYQQPEYDPSILGQMTIAAPNLMTYVILVGAVLVGGSLSYSLVTGADSPVGVALYFIVLGFGSAWLPLASVLILWAVLRNEYPVKRRKTPK